MKICNITIYSRGLEHWTRQNTNAMSTQSLHSSWLYVWLYKVFFFCSICIFCDFLPSSWPKCLLSHPSWLSFLVFICQLFLILDKISFFSSKVESHGRLRSSFGRPVLQGGFQSRGCVPGLSSTPAFCIVIVISFNINVISARSVINTCHRFQHQRDHHCQHCHQWLCPISNKNTTNYVAICLLGICEPEQHYIHWYRSHIGQHLKSFQWLWEQLLACTSQYHRLQRSSPTSSLSHQQ